MLKKEEALEKIRKAGMVRSRDMEALGISRKHLERLHAQGRLERAGRGVYVATDADFTEHQSLLEVTKKTPEAVICLLSALRFHDMTSQNPFQVWIALRTRAWRPKSDYPPLRIINMSGAAFTEGREEHIIGGVALSVYSPAKTVADCFKYRNKIGLDVALEALRDYRRKFRGRASELRHFAQICRVAKVMRPYLESIT